MTAATAPTHPKWDRRSFLRGLLMLTMGVLLAPLLAFVASGDWGWIAAWAAAALTFFGSVISRLVIYFIHPDLIYERGTSLDKKDAASFEKFLVPVIGLIGPLISWIVAGLDHRFGWSPLLAPVWFWLGLAMGLISFVLGTWALMHNRFFSGVVRIQKERDHQVISSGPYAIVRHPGYAANSFYAVGVVLMLGSLWALIPTALTYGLLVYRTALEDRYLHANLLGYADYAQKVRYRLLPGLW